jgi:hypothetical protein
VGELSSLFRLTKTNVCLCVNLHAERRIAALEKHSEAAFASLCLVQSEKKKKKKKKKGGKKHEAESDAEDDGLNTKVRLFNETRLQFCLLQITQVIPAQTQLQQGCN